MSEEGRCPRCKDKSLNYGSIETVYDDEEDEVFRTVECNNCGFIGQQYYRLVAEALVDDEGEEV